MTFADPVTTTIEGILVDVSDHGFRVRHDCAQLVSGLEISFVGPDSAGRARVVWTHLLDGERVSGLVLR